jgi:hypothetical protein
VADPAGLLQEIHRFLGLETNTGLVPHKVRERRNAGEYTAIPVHIARSLARAFRDQVLKLDELLHSPCTAHWLARMDGLLND